MSNEKLVKMEKITKIFPGVVALDEVDFDLEPGEVHVLLGENGAGKSTLMKVLSGVYPPDEGTIYIKGQKVHLKNPHHAHTLGISVVYQEFSLVPPFTVAENLFLGGEPLKGGFISKREIIRRATKALEELEFDLDPRRRIRDLSVAEKQMVEIAKALIRRNSVLILDEPTSSLTDREVEYLFNTVKKVKAKGVGIIYISHRLEEVGKIGDRVTVLRDGKKIATLPITEAEGATLIALMTGRKVTEEFPPRATTKREEEILRIENLSTNTLKNVSLTVRSGEIVGIAGLVGSGKSEVGRAIFGLEKIKTGKIIFAGEILDHKITPKEMIKRGVMYFPADRHGEGLCLCRPVLDNVTLPAVDLFVRGGLIQRKREELTVKEIVDRMNIRPPKIYRKVRSFSGGNQQKIVLSRSMVRNIKLFILDEPTRGIDVGAKFEVYCFLNKLASQGAGVIFISSELPEILNLAHRIIIMHEFRALKELHHSEATEEKVLSYSFGKMEDTEEVNE